MLLKREYFRDNTTGQAPREWLLDNIHPLLQAIEADLESIQHYTFGPLSRADYDFIKTFYNQIQLVNFSILRTSTLQAFVSTSTQIYQKIEDKKGDSQRVLDPSEGLSAFDEEAYMVETRLMSTSSFLLSTQSVRDSDQLERLVKDVNKRANQASSSIEEIIYDVQALQSDLEATFDEASKIVNATKDAAAAIGITEHNKAYDEEAKTFKQASRNWLIATGVATVALIGAVIALFYLELLLPATVTSSVNELHWSSVFGDTVFRLTLVSALTFAVLFCSRNYSAAQHNLVVNRQKMTALRTFRAFMAGSDDPEVKNEILKQAATSIFLSQSSGFLRGEGDAPSNNQIIQLIRDTANPGK